jgi:hypothetical protein
MEPDMKRAVDLPAHLNLFEDADLKIVDFDASIEGKWPRIADIAGNGTTLRY